MKISVKQMILTALFAALMAVGAYIKIPFPFVPLTFQPFFCAFAGIILGSRLGLFSQVIYIIIGLTGIPVFSGGGGIKYITMPTFGFIIGFAAATYVIGLITEKHKKNKVGVYLFALVSGLIVIYVIGIGYLYMVKNLYLSQPVTLLSIIKGMSIFFIKDLVLFIIVAIISKQLVPIVKKMDIRK